MRLDIGHSGTDFRFATARRLFDQGYLPTTISTDLNVFNVDTPVVSLAETISKVWALGVPLPDAIGDGDVGHRRGDRPVRRARHAGCRDGRPRCRCCASTRVTRVLSDGFETITASQRLVPVGCLRAGEWIEADAA